MSIYIVKGCVGICLMILFFLLGSLLYQNRKVQNKTEGYVKEAMLITGREADMAAYKKEISELLRQVRTAVNEESVFDELTQRCSEFTSAFITGVPVVDALIAYKKNVCTEKGIRFETEIKQVPAQLLDAEDYVGLIGNLLDNAMEAAEKTEEPWVRIHGRTTRGQWILQVSNSKRKEEKPLENRMRTTKANAAEHGLGTGIINRIVKKYDGNVLHRDHDSWFEVTVAVGVKEA